MENRNQQIKKYGIEIVKQDEKIWKKRGYKINYKTGLLEKLNNKADLTAKKHFTNIII